MGKVTRKSGEGHKAQYAGWDHRMSVEDNHMKVAHMACLELELMDLSLAKRKAWIYGFYDGTEGNYVLATVANEGYIILENSGEAGEYSMRTAYHGREDGIVPVYPERRFVELDGEDREKELEGTLHVFKIRRVTV
jgi:hypothetical protein